MRNARKYAALVKVDVILVLVLIYFNINKLIKIKPWMFGDDTSCCYLSVDHMKNEKIKMILGIK
ncbi:hypothetical protein AM629_00365 [Photorhabdus heterorhabditis]|uniref:Uncharacterized protein n=1 Tax=Photorhabdus heterorhabditis TaxID=880156 RepID=A0ABR5KH28_9GAMM|nr:hypothetical protein AM629_00365 [Photorhabdus heterorhabditis]